MTWVGRFTDGDNSDLAHFVEVAGVMLPEGDEKAEALHRVTSESLRGPPKQVSWQETNEHANP